MPFKDIRGQDTFKLFNGGFFYRQLFPPGEFLQYWHPKYIKDKIKLRELLTFPFFEGWREGAKINENFPL